MCSPCLRTFATTTHFLTRPCSWSPARRRLPSPVGLPLAGFLRRAQSGLPCQAKDGTLEINAVAFQDGNQAALLIAIDTLIAGPDPTTAAAALARDSFGDGAVAVSAASHTHFAPATDPTRLDARRIDGGLCRRSAYRAAAGRRGVARGLSPGWYRA